MANNAEHIKVLRAMQSHIEMQAPLCDQWFAIATAIRALRNEDKSPWVKATPAKLNKYGGKLVWVAWEDGEVTYVHIPDKYLGIKRWNSVFHGLALYICDNKTEHPEKEVKVR